MDRGTIKRQTKDDTKEGLILNIIYTFKGTENSLRGGGENGQRGSKGDPVGIVQFRKSLSMALDILQIIYQSQVPRRVQHRLRKEKQKTRKKLKKNKNIDIILG